MISRGVSRDFFIRVNSILSGSRNKFIMVRISLKGRKIVFCPPIFLSLGHSTQEGGGGHGGGRISYHITKDGLVLAFAPYAPLMRAFLIRGRNILFLIVSEAYLEEGLHDLIHQGYMPLTPYGSTPYL